jgi:hypothetical protein
VTLPETIQVRFTEEDAEYLNVRPVRRQTFRFDQLIDMILSVTGKDAARVQQILRSGTIVYHFYRYWWSALDVVAADLAVILARFPDADSARAFRPDECITILLEGVATNLREPVELPREVAERHRLLRRRSAWTILLDVAREHPPQYQSYSYSRRADLFQLPLAPEQAAAVLAETVRLAPRDLRAMLERAVPLARVIYVCPRSR